MKLYHRHILLLSIVFGLSACLAACSAPRVSQGRITVSLQVDGQVQRIQVLAGSTVQDALAAAGITLNSQDRSEPPLYTLLTDGASARLIRVSEEFEEIEETIPFERQVVQSESLPEGQKLLTQVGVSGVRQKTIRHLYEDGQEISKDELKPVVLKEAVPEIMVIGVQQKFAPQPIPGRLIYLLGGNAWVMEGTTGNRRPVIKTGDLDGRIFTLTPDGNWLLFTRRSQDKDTINSLWAAKIDGDEALEVDLQIANVVHFAGWAPNSGTLAYSTVEPRQTAPGWQANNNLSLVTVISTGRTIDAQELVETNAGGVYGWWGMNFTWAPDGKSLAYTRPDSVGIIQLKNHLLQPVLNLTPLQTGSEWAWAPGVSWGPDGSVLYTVEHVAPAGAEAPEKSPIFDLVALPLQSSEPIRLVSQVGMFAFPAASPFQNLTGEALAYQVAYLQATFPSQSDTSAYSLMVMDRDGSNRQAIFPPAGYPGLEPQQVVWSPAELKTGGFGILAIYQGNIWLINTQTGEASQITGDGLTVRIDWKGK